MRMSGIPVSEGVALGPLLVYTPPAEDVPITQPQQHNPDAQLARYREAQHTVTNWLSALQSRLAGKDMAAAKIFKAHISMVHDEVMEDEIGQMIRAEGVAAEHAVDHVYQRYISQFQAMQDPLFRQRAADLLDVCRQLLAALRPDGAQAPAHPLAALPQPVILAARDLLPSDTALLDRGKVLAILTQEGGATCHTAILAKGFGIPAVLGVPGLLQAAQTGQTAGVDARSGEVVLAPNAGEQADFEQRLAHWQVQQAEAEAFRHAEPRTADGTYITLGLNLGSSGEAEQAAGQPADYVGLLRTEFLFMERPTLPDEESQYQAYRHILARYAPRPVTLRTLDVGGDKAPPGLPLPQEANSFLGLRGLRLCLARPQLFLTQLRAALRASAHGQLHLMLPMVSSLSEVEQAKAMLAHAQQQLQAEGLPMARHISLGVMIEVPALVLTAHQVAAAVDFASIGSNDLCQYLLAADRGSLEVAPYYRPYHPALLRAIAMVAEAFDQAEKPLGLCGELGGDPLAIPLLVGLGLRRLSMAPAAIPGAKKALAGTTLQNAQALAAQALACGSAQEVERLLRHGAQP